MPELTKDVISEVAKTAVKAAKERGAALEARDFIPAKKYGTPPENFVFKLGSQGLGFYRDGGVRRGQVERCPLPTPGQHCSDAAVP